MSNVVPTPHIPERSLPLGDPPSPLLRLVSINTYYGPIHILQDVSLEIYPGEIVCLLGGNASGKSTTLKTILGIVAPASGLVEFDGKAVQHQPTSYRIERGMAVVPENRRIFTQMSVLENLQMGAYLRRDSNGIKEDLDRIMALFPRLKERQHQLGGTLSGGEQQMLAMGRALMAHPSVILLDEPSMGLSPILTEQIFTIIGEINAQGTTVLLVEQNALMALNVAHRGYVLQTGKIILADTAANLAANEQVRQAYLGEI